ncbi:AI-2E family transporter [Falsihalocynthiibacter sp. S25ZX9]|uniref:AI-2E family transporter n=1 Tax=Falsihalocynthiibacter sp. S25ZX9 TaxID=3240870 RepID=UPI00350FCF2C
MDTDRPSNIRFTQSSAQQWIPVVVLTVIVTFLYLDVARPFLVSLIMAAIVAEMSEPLYNFVLRHLGNRRGPATVVTLLVLLASIITPLIGVAFMAAEQASSLTTGAVGLYQTIAKNPPHFEIPDWVPFQSDLEDAFPQIRAKIQELVVTFATYFASVLGALTKGTAFFFLHLFVFIYSMFYFLQMKTSIISQVLAYSTLPLPLQAALNERIISVSRATLKGTLLIGIAQGALGGLGFWVAGISAPVFWAVVMAIVSIIPALGPTAVVLTGAIYLGVEGETGPAIALGLWAFLVVGTIDNFLRPILVGRDAQIHNIQILIGTLGGLVAFGAVGLVLGPVLAGLFTTVWQTIRDMAPDANTDAVSRALPVTND